MEGPIRTGKGVLAHFLCTYCICCVLGKNTEQYDAMSVQCGSCYVPSETRYVHTHRVCGAAGCVYTRAVWDVFIERETMDKNCETTEFRLVPWLRAICHSQASVVLGP